MVSLGSHVLRQNALRLLVLMTPAVARRSGTREEVGETSETASEGDSSTSFGVLQERQIESWIGFGFDNLKVLNTVAVAERHPQLHRYYIHRAL